MAIQLGDKVRDTITGFSGIVTAKHEYLNGCIRVSITSEKLKDGAPTDPHTFDVEQIEIVKAKAHKKLMRTGGPEKTPARTSVPAR